MSNKIIFQFDDNLEYQKNAVKSVVELFRGLPKTIDSIYAEKIRKTRITEKSKDTGYHSAEFHCTARCS